MSGKIKALLGVAAFYLLFLYAQPYVLSRISIESPAFFHYLDGLTGFPILMSRLKSFLFCLILYFAFTVLIERENWRSAFQLPVSLSGLMKGAGFALALGAGILLLQQVLGLLDVKFITMAYPEMAVTVLAWLLVQVFNATREEFIFRAYIFRRLAGNFNVHMAAIVSSLIFGSAHIAQYQLSGFVFATIGGLIYAYLYIFYRNIWLPIAFHGVWDTLSHTVLGRFLDLQPGSLTTWLGATADSVQMASLIGVNALFLIGFFLWKRLWLLPPRFDSGAQPAAPRLRDGGAP